MLGYRMYATVDGDQKSVLPLARDRLHEWLGTKGYHPDALLPGVQTELAKRVNGLLLEHRGPDGSESVQARITETRPDGARWVTQLTVHVPGSAAERPWVWLDVDAPETGDGAGGRKPKWTATPRLARHLLEVLDARDGRARLAPVPQHVTPGELDAVVTGLRDPARRGLMFLAGSGTDLPFLPWSELVGRLLADTPGLSAAYVLDPEATELFRAAVGPHHAVAVGTIRTYLPGVDVTNEIDGIRHRVLTTKRIVGDDESRIARLLGWKAREAGTGNPLPSGASRVARIFEKLEDRYLLDRLTTATTTAPPTTTTTLPAAPTSAAAPPRAPASASASAPGLGPAARSGGAVIPRQAPSVAEDAERYPRFVELLRDTLGIERVDAETLAEIGRFAALGRRVERVQADLASRLAELQGRLREAEERRVEVVGRLEDEQLEHANTAHELAKAQAETRHLRGLLTQAGHGAAAWTPPPETELVTGPSSFDDLIARLSELDRIRFTGDKNLTFELDQHNPMGIWAAKSWDILRALQDYARVSAEEGFAKDVDGYLRNTPEGCGGFSANQHARDESEDVKNNSRFKSVRTFPVPVEVDPAGKIFMPAHFKIAKSRMISPRLHYWDGTSRTGLVYVGYIGKHLPTKRTN